MIDPPIRRVRKLARGEPRSDTPCPVPPRRGEIASGIAELIAELEKESPGGEWLNRLKDRFQHLLGRGLETARLRRRTRPGKSLPGERIEQLRILVAQFLEETDRLIEALPGKPIYRGDLSHWLEWIEGEFVRYGLADVWSEIRANLPEYGVENK